MSLFTPRDAIWLSILIATTFFVAFKAYFLGKSLEAGHTGELEYRISLCAYRIEELQQALKKAGVAIPPPNEDEPYPELKGQQPPPRFSGPRAKKGRAKKGHPSLQRDD